MNILLIIGLGLLCAGFGAFVMSLFLSGDYVDELQDAYDLGYKKGVQDGKVKKDE